MNFAFRNHSVAEAFVQNVTSLFAPLDGEFDHAEGSKVPHEKDQTPTVSREGAESMCTER